MGENIFFAISYIFYINTVLLNVFVINSKAQIPTGYFTNGNVTWKEAKESCTMIGLLDKVQVSNNAYQVGWVDASVEYTPWVEYLNCYVVRPEYIATQITVSYGNQLLQCLQSWKNFDFIGLQQTTCACLRLLKISNTTIKHICAKKEATTCIEDQYAYCANSLIAHVIYKKVNISEQVHFGNCLSVSGGRDKHFATLPCNTPASPLCTDLHVVSNKVSWINSITQCLPSAPVSYISYKQSYTWRVGQLWLANIRRPIFQQPPELNPEYCVALVVRNEDHKVQKYVLPCTRKLPALCIRSNTKMTSIEENTSTIADETSPGLDSKERTGSSNILLIVLIITAVLAVAVLILVIVLCIRQKSLRSGPRSLIVPNNEVTYAQVNKPTKEKTPVHAEEPTRNNTADETYDHMERHRLSQNQVPSESNYDTMQSVGNGELENDYDVTSGTDRPRQIVVDDNAEYSHMEGEVEYQEIKVVTT